MADPTKARRPPEKKIGPFANGVGVTVWLNQVETDKGTVPMRSVTLNPPRYRDRDTGEWKDSKSYRPSDLPALIFALQQAQAHCYTAALPQDDNPEGGEEDGEIRF